MFQMFGGRNVKRTLSIQSGGAPISKSAHAGAESGAPSYERDCAQKAIASRRRMSRDLFATSRGVFVEPFGGSDAVFGVASSSVCAGDLVATGFSVSAVDMVGVCIGNFLVG